MTTARTLRRALPLERNAFLEATDRLTAAETGALILLALEWWPNGTLPERPADLGRILGTDPQAAKTMASRLRPMFDTGGHLWLLRAAHVVKAERRARAGRSGMSSRWGHSAHA